MNGRKEGMKERWTEGCIEGRMNGKKEGRGRCEVGKNDVCVCIMDGWMVGRING